MLSRSRSTYDHHLNKLGRPHNLNATYQGHQPSGSGEDFYHIWARLLLWSCDKYHLNKLQFTWNLSSIGPVVSEEMFENVDGWTLESLVYYYLTHEPSAQVS